MNEVLLEVKDLHKSFGALVVTEGLSLTFAAGELRCIIGPNGAGKTTLFNMITGTFRPDRGQVVFQGKDITNLQPYQICRRGLVRKFQVPTVFNELSVYDNLRLAFQGGIKLERLVFAKKGAPDEGEKITQILDEIHLSGREAVTAANLSHGEKQWLEIGMALAQRPLMLLLDEPTAGMSPQETMETSRIISKIADSTTTVVIEHDIKFLREIGNHVTVLHGGNVLMEGTFESVAADPLVRDVYLGRRG